jgi:hypothetical protein
MTVVVTNELKAVELRQAYIRASRHLINDIEAFGMGKRNRPDQHVVGEAEDCQ